VSRLAEGAAARYHLRHRGACGAGDEGRTEGLGKGTEVLDPTTTPDGPGVPRPHRDELVIDRGWGERLRSVFRNLIVFGANRIFASLPGHRLRIAYYRHALKWEIGERTSIHFGMRIYGGRGRVRIGQRCTFQIDCLIAGVGFTDLVIGDDVSVAYRASIILGHHDPQSRNFTAVVAPVTIENKVFIGASAIVLAGVTLGEGCMVGAGAVVTKSVAPYTIVGGNPARVIGQRSRDLDFSGEHRWMFH
jgi:acetyltransferase-like isoleucine patch superfamily enzyme